MSEKGETASPALIWCPFPDQDTALRICNSLLDEGLIACANMFPGITSVFEWDGKRDKAEEAGALLKTNSLRLDAAVSRLEQLHPYDEPAILGWRCDAASPGTAAWLRELGS